MISRPNLYNNLCTHTPLYLQTRRSLWRHLRPSGSPQKPAHRGTDPSAVHEMWATRLLLLSLSLQEDARAQAHKGTQVKHQDSLVVQGGRRCTGTELRRQRFVLSLPVNHCVCSYPAVSLTRLSIEPATNCDYNTHQYLHVFDAGV